MWFWRPRKQDRELFYKKDFVKIFAKLRSSQRRCSVKNDILKNFAKLTWIHLCQSVIFNKVVGFRPANFINKETLVQVFSCEFHEIFKNTFLTLHMWMKASVFFKKIDSQSKKRKALAQVFSCEFSKIYQNTNFEECLRTAWHCCGGVPL